MRGRVSCQLIQVAPTDRAKPLELPRGGVRRRPLLRQRSGGSTRRAVRPPASPPCKDWSTAVKGLRQGLREDTAGCQVLQRWLHRSARQVRLHELEHRRHWSRFPIRGPGHERRARRSREDGQAAAAAEQPTWSFLQRLRAAFVRSATCVRSPHRGNETQVAKRSGLIDRRFSRPSGECLKSQWQQATAWFEELERLPEVTIRRSARCSPRCSPFGLGCNLWCHTGCRSMVRFAAICTEGPPNGR